jgi:hypothetical protein
MKVCREVLRTIESAYPCPNFAGSCSSMRWEPAKGHVPRGFLGATSSPNDVLLVLVFAEPGDPHEGERHSGYESALEHTYRCMRDGQDQFHRNVRRILDMCFEGLPFDRQLEKVWMTESVLCSARVECGSVPSAAWRACGSSYLRPQLSLFPNAIVAALGSKASKRLAAIGVPHISATAAAPPGCNHKGAVESWRAIAEAVRRSSPTMRSSGPRG